MQICSYYVSSNLYQKLFNSLERLDIEEDVYVFLDNSYKVKKRLSSNVFFSKCYNKFDRFIFHLKHTKVLTDIKDKVEINKYDITHAHSLFSNGYVSYKLNQEYNIPYIVAVRGTDVNLFFEKVIFLRNMGVKILRNAEKIIFISEPYKKRMLDKFIPSKYIKEIEDKSIIIPNGIDNFWLDNKFEDRVRPKNKEINLIYVGKISTNKNIETTVEACKKLIDKGYKVNYKVVGEIKSEEYKELIKKYSFIEYISFSQKEELIKYYRESDIFVMPSRHETFGLVYAEAMSQGLPIIYTRGQGFDGQFNEGEVGYSVQYDSAHEIANRIIDILDNYEIISNNCIDKVDKFNWDSIAERYIRIYKKVLK